jgi:predicted dinucleotide-utilizing enzyme
MIIVTILGAGNVAQHLYKVFSASVEITVNQWYNRHLEHLQMFKNDVDIVDDISLLKEADIYIIAVSDDAVAEISEQLPFSNKLIVHTSGSVNLHHLDKKNRRGVFYPLQTFSKNAELNFNDVPICIEVEHKADYHELKDLAIAI